MTKTLTTIDPAPAAKVGPPPHQNLKIGFVTNICHQYTRRVFELLAQRYDVDFYFTGGYEDYWEKRNRLLSGAFKGRYLKGWLIGKKLKISFGLFGLATQGHRVFIKTIEDRFALPWVFCLAKVSRRPFILWTQMWDHPRTWFHRVSSFFMKFIYRHSDAIVVYGVHVKKYLTALNVKAEKIFYAYQSTDNKLYDLPVTVEEKQRLKKELGIESRRVILYVGRLVKCR